MMYAIVRNVVTPARISVRTLVPCAVSPKRPSRKRSTLFRPQRRERLVAQNVEAGEHADKRDEEGRQQHAGRVLPRKDAPRDVERVAAHAPCENDGAGGTDKARERPEHT